MPLQLPEAVYSPLTTGHLVVASNAMFIPVFGGGVVTFNFKDKEDMAAFLKLALDTLNSLEEPDEVEMLAALNLADGGDDDKEGDEEKEEDEEEEEDLFAPSKQDAAWSSEDIDSSFEDATGLGYTQEF